MRGSLRKAGPNRWRIRVDLPRGPDGRRRQKLVTVYGTRQKAEEVLADLLARIGKGEYREPSRETVQGYLLRWLETLEGRIRPKTLSGYRLLAERYVAPYVGSLRLSDLTPLALQELYGQLLRTPRERGGTLSPTTVRHVHMMLHAALRDAVDWGLLPANPADRARPPRRARGEQRVLTAEEARRLIAAAKSTRYYAAVVLALLCGLREGEVIGLRWSDIDWEAGRVTVQRTEGRAGRDWVAGAPKTEAGRRTLRVSGAILAALRDHRRAQSEERLRDGPMWEGGDRVCVGLHGRPMRPDTLNHGVQRLMRQAGIPPVRFHALRHSYASLAGSSGVPLKLLSARLGHASVEITADTYSHVYPADDEAAASALDHLLIL